MDATQTVDPKAHDEAEAALYAELERAQRRLASETDRAHRAVGDKHEYRGRRQVWKMRDTDAVARVRELAAAHPEQHPYEGSINHRHPVLVARDLTAAQAKVDELHAAIDAMEEIYLQAPWQRYFPCLNADGHIHASLRGCPTVRFDTAMGWTPGLSGHTVKEAVAELGPTLCSVCFPSAPVEWCRSKSELNAKPVCDGSGHVPAAGTSPYARYATCPKCSYYGALTPSGLVRKHEPKEK